MCPACPHVLGRWHLLSSYPMDEETETQKCPKNFAKGVPGFPGTSPKACWVPALWTWVCRRPEAHDSG